MKISIITVGKKHSPEFADVISEFEKRLRGSSEIGWIYINPLPVKKDGEIQQVIDKEGDLILENLQGGDYVVALDEHGKEKTTVEFSELINKCRMEAYKRLIFIIGGSYGLSVSVKNKANAVVALSRMTLPHQLVRVVLIEQVYRGLSILSGGKYHHE